MGEFLNQLTKAMTWLGEQPDTIFIGQSVLYPGTRMSETLEGVPREKRVEMPVAEDMQLGISIGLSLEGFFPVSIYPRWNFLLCAANQLVNHLDRIEEYSEYRPRVIVRTAVWGNNPLDPGPQHCDDCSQAFADTLRRVPVVKLTDGCNPLKEYQEWFDEQRSVLIVEDMRC